MCCSTWHRRRDGLGVEVEEWGDGRLGACLLGCLLLISREATTLGEAWPALEGCGGVEDVDQAILMNCVPVDLGDGVSL